MTWCRPIGSHIGIRRTRCSIYRILLHGLPRPGINELEIKIRLSGMAKREKRTYTKYNSNTDQLNYEFHYNDTETAELHAQTNNNENIDISDLRRIALWKIDRVLNVSDETIDKLRTIASQNNLTFEDEIVKEAIEGLVASDGIGFPTASAILKFLRPDVFPIIDVRAYRAFTGSKPYYTTYTFERYKGYAQALQSDAKNKKRLLREMDEQLYCFDQDKNRKI